MIGSIVGELIGLVRDHIKGKRDVAVAKAEAEVEIAKRKVTAEMDWDQAWAEQAATSWKDEWFTILFSIPIIAAFIPGGAPYIVAGFEVLATDVPDWYIGYLGAAVAAAFGIRSLKDLWLKRKPPNK